MKARHRKNVITLTGQASSFAIETVLAAFAVVTINSENVFGLERATYVVVMPVISSTLAVMMFATSPELKRHYWEKKTST